MKFGEMLVEEVKGALENNKERVRVEALRLLPEVKDACLEVARKGYYSCTCTIWKSANDPSNAELKFSSDVAHRLSDMLQLEAVWASVQTRNEELYLVLRWNH